MIPCKFFAEGRCTKGSSCPFLHSQQGIASSSSARLPLAISRIVPNIDTYKTLENARPKPICHFFVRGICKKGDACPFSHAASPQVESPSRESTAPSPAPQDTRAFVPCKYFLRGQCGKGKECAYAHAGKADAELDHSVAADTNKEDEQDDFSREMSGAFVHFDDGGRISKLVLSWEYASVRLVGLPKEESKASISALLNDLGFKVSEESIRMWVATESKCANAIIQVDDVSLAKDVCVALLKLKAESRPGYCELDAVPTSRQPPSWSITRRVNCNKVKISWHKATRTAWMNFGNGEIAKRVSDKFNRGLYTVLGQAIKADQAHRSASRGGHNSVAWSVLLRDIPIKATQAQLRDALSSEFDQPRHVEVSSSRMSSDLATIAVFVESLLSKIGSVKFSMLPETQGKRTKAVALFKEEVDARDAVQSLHDKPQDFLNGGKLTVNQICSSKFKIATSIYDVTKDRLSIEATQWRDRHVMVQFYSSTSPARSFVTVKIEGEEIKNVATAANAIEHIVAGKTVLHGDEPLWSPAIASSRGFEAVRQLQKERGVVIVRDKPRRQMKFFGPDEKYDQIRHSLIELLEIGECSIQTIDLSETQYIWACNGGFKQIIGVLGPDVASLDVVSKPRRIVINGTRKEHHVALEILSGKMNNLHMASHPHSNQDCSICWTEAENPVVTSCDHPYCIECIENLCSSAASPQKEFLICCEGDTGACGKLLPLAELQEHLSSVAFEDLLESSFRSYVGRHPQDFRYCPTPDCGYIYRPTGGKDNHICPKCLEAICTGCHQQHGAMACEEYKDIKSGGYEAFKKYKDEMGIKDCPKCTTPMEKTEGCNHMTCGGCGAHVCWVCLKSFPESSQCYDHMHAQHGSIGLDHLMHIF